MNRRSLAWTVVLAIATLSACNNPISRQMPVPMQRSGVDVESVTKRGDYLDAVFVGERFSGRLIFWASDEACARMLVPKNLLVFRNVDRWGEVSDEEGSCSPIGNGSLARWRDSRPSGIAGPQVRRGRAEYQVIFQDEEYVQARGRFPNAALAGFGATEDLVAFLPKNDECANPIEQGTAATEYRSRGPAVILLVATGSRCPVAAFALPPEPGR